jgi:hypothetical protein
MVTFNTRDIPDEIAAAIDLAARRRGQSRQEYMVEKLKREYEKPGNITEGIRKRTEEVIKQLIGGSPLYFKQKPTLAGIAKSLGYDSTAPLDELLRGDRPLLFTEAERLHELFGVNREWLLDGQGRPFLMYSTYSEPFEVLRALALNQLTWGNGNKYAELIAVAPHGDRGFTQLFGQRDESGYRNDLLLSNVPLSKYVGASGRGQLCDFCLLAAALWGKVQLPDPTYPRVKSPLKYSIHETRSHVAKNDEQFEDVMSGHKHLSVARSELLQSHWIQDIWEFDQPRPQSLTPGMLDAQKLFHEDLSPKGIDTNEKLFDYIEGKMQEIRKYAKDASI